MHCFKTENYSIVNMQIFFCNSTDYFLNIGTILASKMLAKISYEDEIVKMALNISLWENF